MVHLQSPSPLLPVHPFNPLLLGTIAPHRPSHPAPMIKKTTWLNINILKEVIKKHKTARITCKQLLKAHLYFLHQNEAEWVAGRGEGQGHSEAKGTSGGGGLTVTGWDVRRGGEGLG